MRRAAWATLGVWLLLVALCAAVVSRSSLSTDLQAFLPQAPTAAQQVLVDQLREGVVSRLVLIAIGSDEPATLAALSRAVRERLAGDPAFDLVHNGSEDQLQRDSAFLIGHRYLLSAAVTTGHFSADNLRRSLQRQLELLASSLSALSGHLLPRDPTGEYLTLIEQYAPRHRPQLLNGVWFDADGAQALLIARTTSPGFDIDAQRAALNSIETAFAHAASAAGNSQASLTALGPGVFAVQTREVIKTDAIRVTTLAALAISALLLFVMGSPRALFLILLPVATGALAGAAAVAQAFGAIHGITIAFGATLIGESVDYAIHLLTGAAPGERPERALDRIWPTLRLGVLTSVVGSAALLLSGFPGLAQLGLFSIVGLVVALGVTRWVIPLLVPAGFSVSLVTRWEAPLRRFAEGAHVARLPAMLLVVICLLWLVHQGGAAFNDDFESLSPIPRAQKSLDRALRSQLGAPDVRTLVVVRGVDEEATLQIAESVGRVLDDLVDQGALGGYQSPSRYLPSLATQRLRQASIPPPPVLRANLEQAAASLPFKPGLFERFLEEAQSAKNAKLLTPRDLVGTSLAEGLDSLLLPHGSGWQAMLPLQELTQMRALEAALSKFDPQQVTLVDLKAEMNEMYRGYRMQILTYAMMGSIAIMALLLGALRSLRRCAAVIMPIVAALAVCITMLALAGAELTMFHLVAMLLVIGVGSNYTLFFDEVVEGDSGSGRIYASLLICNLTTVIGFALVGLATTPVLEAIGATVSVGAASSLFFGAVFMRRRRTGGASATS